MIPEELKQYSDRWEPLKATPGIVSISDKLSIPELAKIEILKDFDAETLQRLAPDIAIVEWESGSEIFKEGAYTDTAYYVFSGHVKLTSSVMRELTVTATEEKMNLSAGDIFGETGTVSGWPQTFTATTSTPCTILHVRTPALRLMRRKSKPFHSALENEYRKKGLIALLKSTSIFSNISEIALYQHASEIELLSFEPGEEISREGERASDLHIVRAGFVKLSRRMGDTEVILNYLNRGAVFGEMEFLKRPASRFHASVSAVEYVDIVKIPYAIIEKLIPYDFTMVNKINESARQTSRQYKDHEKDLKRSALLQMGMETGIIEGTSILVIDLDRCTRCDDCVRGCADTHGGLPRFVREGSRYENMLITRACYQCKDPMCLIGCPTGAIRRAGIGEVVEIKDDLCIGCKICAVNCPYDAIVMHETGEMWGYDALPKNLRGNERLLASKCDLCAGLNHGPACVESCPIDCAMRIESIDELV